MNMDEYFDPNNKKHLEAFRHLGETGWWPSDSYEGAKEAGVEPKPGDSVGIAYKIAFHYIAEVSGQE